MIQYAKWRKSAMRNFKMACRQRALFMRVSGKIGCKPAWIVRYGHALFEIYLLTMGRCIGANLATNLLLMDEAILFFSMAICKSSARALK